MKIALTVADAGGGKWILNAVQSVKCDAQQGAIAGGRALDDRKFPQRLADTGRFQNCGRWALGMIG